MTISPTRKRLASRAGTRNREPDRIVAGSAPALTRLLSFYIPRTLPGLPLNDGGFMERPANIYDEHWYAVAHDYPHATKPDVRVQIWIHDPTHNSGWDPQAELLGFSGPVWLLVPVLDGWTLDTVAMVLHELSAYLPSDADAMASVKARLAKPRGRQGKTARPLRVDRDVEFVVEAREWRASFAVRAREAAQIAPDGAQCGETGDWSDPMIDALVRLAAQSPFPLASLECVRSGQPYRRVTSRLALQQRAARALWGGAR